MENSEILGFQFDPKKACNKAFQPDSSLGENWETCWLADSEPSTTTQSKASADTLCMCFNCIQILTMRERLCHHELNEFLFKTKKLDLYLLNDT